MSRWQNPYNEKHFNGIQNHFSTVTLISLISTELFFLICLFEFFTERKRETVCTLLKTNYTTTSLLHLVSILRLQSYSGTLISFPG